MSKNTDFYTYIVVGGSCIITCTGGDNLAKEKPRLEVVDESDTGLNRIFRDTKTNEILSRREAADRIERGEYPDYHIMHKDNRRIPRSNPDHSKNNNLD